MTIDPEELISERETAALLFQRPTTLTAWRHENRGPAYLKIGRAVRYRRSDVNAWLGARRREPAVA
jgi:predicted DNA-binding transcriptional regulator AlpA